MNEYIEKINKIAKDLKREIKIMEVCGGHTNAIAKHAIKNILPKNIKLISGPGCPVCVTSQKDIDNVIALAESGIKIATYGDMLHVPGTKKSLAKAREQGANIIQIYSTTEIPKEKDTVFFAIGFETTAPMTAHLLKNNITIYPTHKTMIPAMKEILKQNKIDGFILPGHVSAIIGSSAWNEIKAPQVITGFEKEHILRAISKLLEAIQNKNTKPINDYPEIVTEKGNEKAQNLIKETLKPVDENWRGLGTIPLSGLEPINENLNAKIKYSSLLKNIKSQENKNCKCSEIIRGLLEPKDCPLFKKVCTPQNPIGACMVSTEEGTCAIAYKYNERK